MDAWYSVPDIEGEERFKIRLASPHQNIHRPIEQADIAELAAHDYFHSQGGWEHKWPVDIVLYASESGEPVARCNVDMEREPRFHAYVMSSR